MQIKQPTREKKICLIDFEVAPINVGYSYKKKKKNSAAHIPIRKKE